MKLKSLILLLIFLNFTVSPVVFSIFNWDLPQTNIIIEEENNSASLLFKVVEKTVPKTLNILDFLRFPEFKKLNNLNILFSESNYVNPYYSIFIPPPEL